MASKKKNVILPLAAAVRTDDGVRTLVRGDTLPDNILSEERDRLERNGNLGTAEHAAALPPAGTAEPIVRETPLDAAKAAITRQEIADLQQEAEQDVAQKIAELHTDGTAAPTGDSTAAAPTAPGVNSDNAAFDTYIAEANVDQVVAAVDAAPEGDREALAQAYLESEESVREKEGPRKSLVEALTARGAKPAGS